MLRHLAGGLPGDGLPGAAAVGGAVQGGGLIGDADIDRLAAGRAVGHEGDARAAARPVLDGERGDLTPCRAVVGAAPQAVLAGAQQQGAVVRRVDRQPLARPAAVLVAAQLERQLGALEGAAPVRGAQDRAVTGPLVGVGARREVEPVGVDGVGGQRIDAQKVPVLLAEPVGQRDPLLGRGLPAVGAAHVCAGVQQTLLARVEHQPGDVTAAHHLGVVPHIRSGCLGLGRFHQLPLLVGAALAGILDDCRAVGRGASGDVQDLAAPAGGEGDGVGTTRIVDPPLLGGGGAGGLLLGGGRLDGRIARYAQHFAAVAVHQLVVAVPGGSQLPLLVGGVLVGPLLDAGAVGGGEGVDVKRLAAAYGNQPVVGIAVDRRGLRAFLHEQEIRHDDGGHAEQQTGRGPATAMTPAAPAVRGVLHGGCSPCMPPEESGSSYRNGRIRLLVVTGPAKGCLEPGTFQFTSWCGRR